MPRSASRRRPRRARKSRAPPLPPRRVAAAAAVLLALCYEFVVLRAPLAAAAASAASAPASARHPVDAFDAHAATADAHAATADAHVDAFDAHAATAARVRAAAAAAAEREHARRGPPPPRPPPRPSAHHPALALEAAPADADPNDPAPPPAAAPPRSARPHLARRAARPALSSRDGVGSPSSSLARHRDLDRDIEPPKPRVRSRARDLRADPGAGENFWQWFQETKGSEKGDIASSVACPEESRRLCQMTYKYLRKYKIRAVFDVSCGKNLEWMGPVLHKVANELWGFKYYCSETDPDAMAAAKDKFSDNKFVEFVPDEWWRTGFPEDTELLFAWDTLPHIAYGRIWNFFVKARKQEVKYILVDNYPGILNDPSPKRNYLNLRKHPFRFPAAKEVVQNVTEPGETAKRQLLFYESSMLPDNLQ